MLARPDAETIACGPVSAQLIAEGDRIVASVRRGTPFEPKSLKAWARLCARGGTVLDIGAYTGLFSIAARLLGCRAIAFEPLHANRVRFRENAALNGVSDKVNCEAVSDRVGQTMITVNPKVKGLTSGASLIRQTGTQVVIRTVTVDSLNLSRLDAMKIDVERAEPLVLAGARETIAKFRPIILVEVLDRERKRGVMDALRDYEIAADLDGRNWLMRPC